MANHIHQLNASYVAAEDRILLRLNTTRKEEFRIWLTRRIVRELARMLGGAERRLLGLEGSYAGAGARAIQEFRREASTANVDFGARFEDGSHGFPLGEAPLLATGCEVQLQEGSASIGLAMANKHTLNFVLDLRGIHGTLAMLQKAAAHSDWDLDLEPESEGPSMPAAERRGLH
jgi:hypothetical protein